LGALSLHSAALYDVLLRPVEDILERHQRLLIVPDQELCYLPFESLADDRRPGRPRVVSRWSVSYVPSVTALVRIRERSFRGRGTGLQFVGSAHPTLPPVDRLPIAAMPAEIAMEWPSLPEARQEMRAISALFPPRGRAVFLGEDATERRVKTEPRVEQAALLHFAAHTVIDTRRPGRSSLVLGPGHSSEDGLLQVREIFDLDLSARLVVLSGCQTGLGREMRGEGLVGMTQAFFYAGADALLVSLWPVPDRSTGDLMVRLYEEMEGGTPAAEALRRAKLAILDADPTLHPFYWSAFVLVGRAT
jgi:CHAT domain-containing protein